MFASIKRLFGSASSVRDEGHALSTWAKAEGHAFKRVQDKAGGGFVVESNQGWRVEWGASQRPYIQGKELRFRCDTGVSGDVQLIMITKVLAQALESDVFARYTNAMQTQIDNTLPDEMRWLAMHPRVVMSHSAVLSKRFALFCNAQAVADQWLDSEMSQVIERAAISWWMDGLMLVLTLNRGIVTMRMSGQSLEQAQLKLVSELFAKIASRLRAVSQAAA
ncbi:MAG: hypothetical protein Q7U28_03040 [Aquabacterium sp.]|nr:hypothetical protein [Aquabacterium sp.]